MFGSTFRRWRLALTLLCVTAALGCDQLLGGTPPAGEGEATGSDGTTTAADISGIHAFGSVVGAEDGSVDARLDVVTFGETPRYLSGIANPTLTHAGTTFPLFTADSVGAFETDSTVAAALTYVPGDAYTFSFEVTDEEGVLYMYSATVTAPDDPRLVVEAAPTTIRYAGEPVELSLLNTADAVSVRVSTAGSATFDTTGINDLSQAWLVLEAMRASATSQLELPGAAFTAPGFYTIEVTNLGIETPTTGGLSAGLGEASWVGVGTSARLILEVQ